MSSFGYSKAVSYLHRNISACGVRLESTGLHSWFPKPKAFSLKHLVTKDASLGPAVSWLIRNLPGLRGASSRSVTRTREASSIGQWPSLLLLGFCSRASGSSSVLVCPPFSPAGPHYPGSCEWVCVAPPWLIKLSDFFLFLSPGWLILFEISQCF